jgi:hypothetical protein
MKNKQSKYSEQFENLVKRKEELQSKQRIAYSNNMSQQIFDQLSSQLQMVEMELYHISALQTDERDKVQDDNNPDGLII